MFDKKPIDHKVVAYRQCFSTDAGKKVLEVLLIEGGYFYTDLETEGEIAVQNFVKKLVLNLGIFSIKESSTEKSIIGVDSYIDGLFKLPSNI